jgi:hypothetical protein
VYYGQFSYGSFIYFLLYVGMLIAAKIMFEVKRLKSLLRDEFEIIIIIIFLKKKKIKTYPKPKLKSCFHTTDYKHNNC